MDPSEQVKLPVPVLGLQEPCVVVTPVRVKPAGQVSVRLTFNACDGPLLLTTIVYVRVTPSPAVTDVTPSLLLTDKSALVVTVSVSLAVLLAVFGSDVLLVT